MKKVSSYLYQLNNDKRCLYFCILIFVLNIFYLYQNNDNYFIFGSGYGLERILNVNQDANPILNMNVFFLRSFSYLGNLIAFNFIFLMLYNIIFKTFKPAKIETHFVYILNVLLILVILYMYFAMR
jgi:hypothetical protein